MTFIKKLFTPPIFEDEEKTHQAHLLHTILLSLIIIPIPFVIYVLIQMPEEADRALVSVLVAEVINIIPFIMLRRGHVRYASLIQIITLWSFFAFITVVGAGIYGIAYLLGNGLVITISGILLGGRGALAMTLLAMIEGGIMVYAELHGWSPPDILDDAIPTWTVSIVLFAVGAVLQNLASRTLRTALARAKASEEKYRLISQVSSDYVFATEVHKDGSADLSWVAGAFEKMTGYSYEEYVASGSWLGHMHPEDLEKDAEDMETLYKNQDIKSEIRTFAKNGDIRWERIFAHPIWDEKENRLTGIIGAVQDVTEQKRIESALAHERDLLQIFMDNIPDTVYFKDTESRFVRINQAQARFLGIDNPEDAIGKTDLDFQDAELAQKFMAEEKQIAETGQGVINRIEFNQVDSGKPIWLSTTKVPVKDRLGNVIGIIGISRDVTEQKQIEHLGQRRRIMLEKVIELGKHVTETNDLRTTVKKIWDGVHNGLGFDRQAIFLFNPERNSMDDTFGTDNQGQMIDVWDLWFPITDNISESSTFMHVLEKPDGLYFTHDYSIDHHVPEGHDMYGVKEFAAVAAWTGNKPVAVICVDNLISMRPITPEQLEALRLFAGYAGLAIENARLNETIQKELSQQIQAKEQEEHRRTILEKVISIGQHVTEVYDLRTALIRIWEGIHDGLSFDRIGIYLYNSERNSMDGTFGTNHNGEMIDEWNLSIPLRQDIQEAKSFLRVLEKPDVLYFTSTFEKDYNTPTGHIMSGVKDFAAIGAWAGEKPVAVLCVDRVVTGQPITEEQLEALRLFAGYAGLAIENARLNETIQKELSQKKMFIEELESKNAELERFTYTVSHDLKSPLVTIKGFLGYLERDAQQGNFEKFRHDVQRIEAAVAKMQNLLKDLLELSRIGRLMNTPVEVSFEEVVKDALEIVHGQIQAKNILIEFHNHKAIIKCDRVRIVEVLQNLIDNAIKFMDGQSRPRIEIGSFNSDKKETVFYVKDNGVGIADEFHDKIFGLFNKLNIDSDGTGIGLALVKRIIEVHGGRIWVESQIGKGTTFYFTLA